MACVPLVGDGGLTACIISQGGQACGDGLDCAAPYACLGDAGCLIPLNTTTCKATAPCAVGDDCSAHFNLGSADTCLKDGLFCGYLGVNASQTAYVGACLQPFVVPPPSFPGSFTQCLPSNNLCLPATGAQRTAPICGSFWYTAASAADICMESCTTTSDCSSLAEQCVGGACVPVYCYVSDGPTADAWTTAQGSPVVSADAGVLFQSCNLGGDTPSYCLPQADPNYDAHGDQLTSGICMRVGGSTAGGVGAACDPNMYGNNPGALCAAGFICERGTCLPWCELHDKYVSPCVQNALNNIGCAQSLTLPLPANITITRSTGVCIEECDPYAPANDAGNGCTPFNEDLTCTEASPVCKLNGQDNYLAAGVCLTGAASPIPVGGACDPVSGWTDPCVSGAQCTVVDAGFACAQLCDPAGSASTSHCPSPTTCNALGGCQTTTGACTHQGICL